MYLCIYIIILMCVSLHHHSTKSTSTLFLSIPLSLHFALYTCYHFKQHRTTNEHKNNNKIIKKKHQTTTFVFIKLYYFICLGLAHTIE